SVSDRHGRRSPCAPTTIRRGRLSTRELQALGSRTTSPVTPAIRPTTPGSDQVCDSESISCHARPRNDVAVYSAAGDRELVHRPTVYPQGVEPGWKSLPNTYSSADPRREASGRVARTWSKITCSLAKCDR